nr:hypothetical transcript [Hymenolepis microstoma]
MRNSRKVETLPTPFDRFAYSFIGNREKEDSAFPKLYHVESLLGECLWKYRGRVSTSHAVQAKMTRGEDGLSRMKQPTRSHFSR